MSNDQGNQLNEQELIAYIAAETNVDAKSIELVLKLEQKFIDNAQEDAKGEVEIDSDELVDFILKQQNVKLDEMTVENILEAEMDYLLDKGIVGYIRLILKQAITGPTSLTGGANEGSGPSSTRNREPLSMELGS